MKKFWTATSLVVLSAATGLAFDIPRGVHEIDGLEEAKTEAAEKKRPVVFLISRKSLKPT